MQSDFDQYADEIKNGLTEWEQPIPFDEITLPPFPVKSLPDPLSTMVACLSENTQTPEEMAGLLALGVLATAFQPRYWVQVTPDWREPLCLYIVIVAPPGERKSAVLSALTAPIREYENERCEIDAVEIARNRTERDMLEDELKVAKAAATRGKGDKNIARQRALELTEELANFKTLNECRLLVGDSTPEKLVDLMEQQGGCITVCSSEGGIFDAMRGRYDKSLNIDVYLQAHAGEPIVVDRIGRRSNRVDKARMTMVLAIQPQVLTGLVSDPAFRGRGLCGRFLYAMCRSKVGNRDVTPPPVPDIIKTEYRKFVRRILSDQGTGTIVFSQDALDMFNDYHRAIEKRLGGKWENMRDWAGKLAGATARIVALMHCAEATGDLAETPISVDTVLSGINIAEYLGAHAAAAYQAMGADDEREDAKYLWRKISRSGAVEISRRDLFAMCQSRFKRTENMAPAVKVLTDMGYIREETKRTGGRPTVAIVVNPLAKGG